MLLQGHGPFEDGPFQARHEVRAPRPVTASASVATPTNRTQGVASQRSGALDRSSIVKIKFYAAASAHRRLPLRPYLPRATFAGHGEMTMPMPAKPAAKKPAAKKPAAKRALKKAATQKAPAKKGPQSLRPRRRADGPGHDDSRMPTVYRKLRRSSSGCQRRHGPFLDMGRCRRRRNRPVTQPSARRPLDDQSLRHGPFRHRPGCGMEGGHGGHGSMSVLLAPIR